MNSLHLLRETKADVEDFHGVEASSVIGGKNSAEMIVSSRRRRAKVSFSGQRATVTYYENDELSAELTIQIRDVKRPPSFLARIINEIL